MGVRSATSSQTKEREDTQSCSELPTSASPCYALCCSPKSPDVQATLPVGSSVEHIQGPCSLRAGEAREGLGGEQLSSVHIEHHEHSTGSQQRDCASPNTYFVTDGGQSVPAKVTSQSPTSHVAPSLWLLSVPKGMP